MIDEAVRFATLERLLGRLMLAGVVIAALCLLTGLALWLVESAGELMLRAGLFVLMATPMLRVSVALVEAVREEDWFLVGTTLSVMLLVAVTLYKSYALAFSR